MTVWAQRKEKLPVEMPSMDRAALTTTPSADTLGGPFLGHDPAEGTGMLALFLILGVRMDSEHHTPLCHSLLTTCKFRVHEAQHNR